MVIRLLAALLVGLFWVSPSQAILRGSGGSAPEYTAGHITDDLTIEGFSSEIHSTGVQVDSTGGTLTKLCVRLGSVGASPGVKMALYGPVGSDGDSENHSLIVQTSGAGSVGVNCYSATGTLNANGWYGVNIVTESVDTKYLVGAETGPTRFRNPGTNYAGAFASTGASSAAVAYNYTLSVWLVYEH